MNPFPRDLGGLLVYERRDPKGSEFFRRGKGSPHSDNEATEENQVLPTTRELEELEEDSTVVPLPVVDERSESEKNYALPPLDPDAPVDLVDLLEGRGSRNDFE